MKKIINRPEDVVRESLRGLAAAHPDLVKVNFDPNYVYRADAPVQGKVAIISGGGSGHEPMHTGFVGYGMLDAACPGEVFTSPTPDQMYEAAKKVNGGAGILYIVKNYSGDVMNFDMAAEMARADGIQVELPLIADDVAVEKSEYSQGRRGVGATVLAEKICGAAAEQHANLRQVYDLCRKVNDNARSMGVALTSCTVPMKGTPTFDLAPNEIELGIGIHGERGRFRTEIKSAREIAETMTEAILGDLPFRSGDQVLAFVNSMGATPIAELYILYDEMARICDKKGIKIVRRLIGPYITSLDMMGASITLLRLDEEMLRYWDHPVKTPGLRWGM